MRLQLLFKAAYHYYILYYYLYYVSSLEFDKVFHNIETFCFLSMHTATQFAAQVYRLLYFENLV